MSKSDSNKEVVKAVTMTFAFNLLEKGTITADQFKAFIDKMVAKYKDKNIATLYQSKLDIWLKQRVNTIQEKEKF